MAAEEPTSVVGPSDTKAAVVLLSGGLDSTVALAWWLAQPNHTVVLAVTVDYGQRAAPQEIAASASIAAHYQVPHQVVTLDWLRNCLPTGLLPGGASHLQGPLPTPAVWVPNRNGVMLNLAAALAEAKGAAFVVFGSNKEEAEAGFPDNTAAYRQALNQALRYSTANAVQVVAPVEQLDKAAIVALGKQLGAPFQWMWSCYEGGPTPCGQCASCRLRVAG